MPTFKVTDPSTGKTLRLTGDSPPTEQELDEIFKSAGSDDGRPVGALNKWKTLIGNVPSSFVATDKAITESFLGDRTVPGALNALGNMAKLPIGLWNKVMPEGINIPGQGEAEKVVEDYGNRLEQRYSPSTIISAPEKTVARTEQTLIEDPVGTVLELYGIGTAAKNAASGLKSGIKKGVSKVGEIAPESVRGKVDSWSETLYGKAISPPTRKSLSLKKIEQGLQTGLDKEWVPSKSNLKKLRNDIYSINDRQANWFRAGTEKPVLLSVDDIAAGLSDLVDEFAHDANAVGQIRTVTNMLLKPTKDFAKKLVRKDGKTFIPSDVAHDLKRTLYKELGDRPYGVVDTLPAQTLAKRRLAASLRESIANEHPGLQELTSAESKLIALDEIAAPRIRRELNNQWWSLGTKGAMIAGHALGGPVGTIAGTVVGYMNRSPAFQAKTAILMNRFAKAGVRADRAAVERMLAAAPSELLSFYTKEQLDKFNKTAAAREAEPARAAAEQEAWKARKVAEAVARRKAEEANAAGVSKIAKEKEPLRGQPTVERDRAAAEQAAWRAQKEAEDARTAASTERSSLEIKKLAAEKEPVVIDKTLEGIPKGREIVLEGITERGKKFSYKENARTAYTESQAAIESLSNASGDLVEGEGSVMRTMNKHKVPPAVRTTVMTRVRAYLKEGLSKEDAAISAIADAVAEFEKTRKEVLRQIGADGI